MFWLFTQVWVWIVCALLLGVLAGWLFWARPVQRAADAIDPAVNAAANPAVDPAKN